MGQDGVGEMESAINRAEVEQREQLGESEQRDEGGKFTSKTKEDAKRSKQSAESERLRMEKLAKDMPEQFGNLLEDEDDLGSDEQHETTEEPKGKSEVEEVSVDKKKETGAARTAALKVLQLDGWDETDLAGLSDERVLAMSKKREKVHRESNQARDELAALKKGTAASKQEHGKQQGSSDETEEGFKGEPDDVLEDAVKGFEEFYGQEATDGLRKFGKALTEKLEKRFAGEIAKRDELLAPVLMDSVRQRLTKVYPDLGDAELWSKVEAKATKLAPSYTDVGELFDESAKIVLHGMAGNEGVRKAKAQGSMSVPNRKAAGTKNTRDDAGFEAFKAIVRGKDYDTVKRTFNEALNS